MAMYVFGPGFQSADGCLLLALFLLVLSLAQIVELRKLTASAHNWKRFASWFPVAAERFDRRFKGYNPALAAMVILQRAQRAETELRGYRQENAEKTGQKVSNL